MMLKNNVAFFSCLWDIELDRRINTLNFKPKLISSIEGNMKLIKIKVFASLVGAVSVLFAGTNAQAQQTWTGAAGDYNWQTAGNWSGGVAPIASGQFASFNNAPSTAGNDIILNGDVTLGTSSSATMAITAQLDIAGRSYSISGANGGSNNTLTLNASSGGYWMKIDGTSSNNRPTVSINNANIVLNNSGSTGNLSFGGGAILNFGSNTTVNAGNSAIAINAIRAGDVASTWNINSSTWTSGTNNSILQIKTGTVNWGVTNFTTAAATPVINLGYSNASTQTLNFTKSYSSNTTSGAINVGSGVTSYSAAITAADGVKVSDVIYVNAGTVAASTSTLSIGVVNANSTGTFAGVHMEQYNNSGTNVLNVAFTAATNSTAVFTGLVEGYRRSGTAAGSPLVLTKTGAGTVVFAGSDTVQWQSLSYAAFNPFDVKEGKLKLAATSTITNAALFVGAQVEKDAVLEVALSNQIADNAVLVMAGGTFQVDSGVTETLGTLNVTGDSLITLGGGNVLSFAATTMDWGTSLLNIDGFTAGSIRFGTNNLGLVSTDFDNIGISGSYGLVTGLDANGYLLAVPEPTTWAMLISSTFALGFAVRRRKSVNA